MKVCEPSSCSPPLPSLWGGHSTQEIQEEPQRAGMDRGTPAQCCNSARSGMRKLLHRENVCVTSLHPSPWAFPHVPSPRHM